MALADGDHEKARYQYIRLRVEQLVGEGQQEQNSIFASEADKDLPFLEGGPDSLGFRWWSIWAWLNLTIGILWIFVLDYDINGKIGLYSLVLCTLTVVVMVAVLRHNKYAFLIGTVLSLNPILWVVNGVYLYNRWNHPRVNGSPPETEVFALAASEFSAGKIDPGLMAFSLSKSEGDEKKAAALYIKLRAKQIKKALLAGAASTAGVASVAGAASAPEVASVTEGSECSSDSEVHPVDNLAFEKVVWVVLGVVTLVMVIIRAGLRD